MSGLQCPAPLSEAQADDKGDRRDGRLEPPAHRSQLPRPALHTSLRRLTDVTYIGKPTAGASPRQRGVLLGVALPMTAIGVGRR